MKKFAYLFLAAILSCIGAQAQEEIENALRSGNMGTEFWLTVPPCPESEYSTNTNRIKLFVTSYVTTRVRAESADGKLFQEIDLPAGVTRAIELYPEQAQPFIATYYSNQYSNRVYPGTAFRVVAEDPIVLFVVLSFRTDSEGYLALPTGALGTQYRVSSYSDAAGQYGENVSYPSLAGIVAAYDNTVVSLIPCSEHNTFKPYSIPGGDTVKKTLNRGDVWVFSSRGGESDLSGSSIESTMPIAVVTANQCANVPLKNRSCEYITEMESPVATWGKTYFAPKIYGRKFAPVVRIYALQDTTTIYRNGVQVGKIDSSSAFATRNFIELRTSDGSPQSAVFTADKPISVTLYNPGTEEDGLPTPRGDCFQTELTPFEQFSNEILLATPVQQAADAAISEHYVNLVYKKTGSAQIPDDLEIGSMRNGSWIWEKIKYINLKETETFQQQIDGSQWGRVLFKVVEGAYRIRSANQIWAYVYGYMPTGSYGMPATAGLAKVSIQDMEPPVPVWQTFCMGEVRGTVTDKPDDASVRSNLSTPVYYSHYSENYVPEFQNFVPGKDSVGKFILRVRNPRLNAKAVITFRDVNRNDTTITIIYKAPKLRADPEVLDFGQVNKNVSWQDSFELKNESDSTINIPKVSLKYGDRGFSITTPTDKTSLKPGESALIWISFKTTLDGEFLDSLGAGDDCFFANVIELRARTGEQIIKADDAQFGEVTIGKADSASVMVSNDGSAELTITGVKFNTSPSFTSDIPTGVSAANPIVIPPQSYRSFNIYFSPNKIGDYRDSIVFSSNASYVDSVISISARGVSPGLASNSPAWNRCRINRAKFPAGPYYPNDGSRGLKLINNGAADASISSIEIESVSTPDGTADAFTFDKSAFNNLTLKPGGDTIIPALFNPTLPGVYELSIKYVGDGPEPTRSKLSGVGVVPRLKTSIEKFDTTLANSSLMSYRILRITNLSLSEWEYGDSLTIYSIAGLLPEEISSNWNAFGSKGYKIDLSAISFPRVLKPGESIEAPIAFSPKSTGIITANLIINSDAENEGKVELQGYGIGDEITAIGDTASGCSGGSDTLYVEVVNHGDRRIELSKLEFNPPKEEFVFADSSLINDLVLPAISRKTIPIVFKPGKLSFAQSKISFIDKRFPEVSAVASITGHRIFAGRKTLLGPLYQFVNAGAQTKLRLSLEPGEDLDHANVRNILIELNNNANFLMFDESSLEFPEDISSRFVTEVEEFTSNKVKIRISSIDGSKINKQSDILKIGVKTLLPSGDNSIGEVTARIVNLDNECAEFESAQSQIGINPVCGGDLRKIEMSPYDYALTARTTGDALIVDYGLAFAADTKIEAFTAAGERAALLVDGNVAAGAHSINYDATALSSGIYFIVISSGPYREVVKVSLIK